jgi:hypothetical protein
MYRGTDQLPAGGGGIDFGLGENFGHVGSILAVERGCSFGSYEFVI